MIASQQVSCYLDAPWLDRAMGLALEQAQCAARLGEVPVGAVVFWEGEPIARAHNLRETRKDPLAHAETLALAQAAKTLDQWRLDRAAMVVTLEPCLMCMGALILARVPLIVYGADDPRAGAAGTLYDVSNDPRLNHAMKVVRGVRREESAQLLQQFFRERRDSES